MTISIYEFFKKQITNQINSNKFLVALILNRKDGSLLYKWLQFDLDIMQ